jgi:hypothetical protein
MHGMLSLVVLVAAFAGLAGWIGCMLARLYRACPVGRSSATQPSAGDPAGPPTGGGSGDPAGPSAGGAPAGEHTAAPQTVI